MQDATCSESSAIRRLRTGEREIVLVGTAHISRDSLDTVRRVITAEVPDTICVELDHQRHQTLKNRNHWESLNIFKVIRAGQAPFLLVSLALTAFQKRLGLQTGMKPGAELAAAAEMAEAQGRTLRLIDRDIRTTLLRAWRKTGFWKKMQLVSSLAAGFFDKPNLNEAELARLRQTDTLSAMLEEMGETLPSIKTILVDERDQYMSQQIRQAPGRKIVVVVGAAHIPGMLLHLEADQTAEHMAEISSLPAKKFLSRVVPWIFPAIVATLFLYGFSLGDWDRLAGAALAWVLANGLLSALGALLALGHPLTVVAAFIAAPITSLNPTMGAGFVTGLVQACVASPTVRDLERVGDDLTTLRGWYGNRTTRVLLVFFFSSLGSTAGTIVALHWLKDLL